MLRHAGVILLSNRATRNWRPDTRNGKRGSRVRRPAAGAGADFPSTPLAVQDRACRTSAKKQTKPARLVLAAPFAGKRLTKVVAPTSWTELLRPISGELRMAASGFEMRN